MNPLINYSWRRRCNARIRTIALMSTRSSKKLRRMREVLDRRTGDIEPFRDVHESHHGALYRLWFELDINVFADKMLVLSLIQATSCNVSIRMGPSQSGYVLPPDIEPLIWRRMCYTRGARWRAAIFAILALPHILLVYVVSGAMMQLGSVVAALLLAGALIPLSLMFLTSIGRVYHRWLFALPVIEICALLMAVIKPFWIAIAVLLSATSFTAFAMRSACCTYTRFGHNEYVQSMWDRTSSRIAGLAGAIEGGVCIVCDKATTSTLGSRCAHCGTVNYHLAVDAIAARWGRKFGGLLA